ncbi:peptidoglycan-binding protein [Paenarthrobacter sp. DKR-5]|uniref:peptidoglycan-binding protein n=1 Tax=Paenarthrobacter sp. DKR-5 TaxID=2835535 RepID=UPI001BDD56E3|nr:peptidoglycan-binding protein [Paenarthrobacter sp. DKR-5]MBT1001426.1 peptidoglycan-binding protein [Paenarthrobacter sp. DKR-5]
MSNDQELTPLTDEELAAEGVTALPDKEVASILDLNADLNLGIDAAAPIDLAVAANANVAAPIDASASANVLSAGSAAAGMADQGVLIDQGINADATANSVQDSTVGQGAGTDPTAGATTDPTAGATTDPTSGTATTDPTAAVNGNLLNVDVNVDANAGIAAPINGAVAANANVAAPIDASVAANIGSIDSNAVAVSQQDAVISQHIDGAASAASNQQSNLQQN